MPRSKGLIFPRVAVGACINQYLCPRLETNGERVEADSEDGPPIRPLSAATLARVI